jgi:hypothetical protein
VGVAGVGGQGGQRAAGRDVLWIESQRAQRRRDGRLRIGTLLVEGVHLTGEGLHLVRKRRRRDSGARPPRHRADAQATRLRNQLQQLVLQADPEYEAHLPRLRTRAGVAALAQYTVPGSPARAERRAAGQRLARRPRLALDQAEAEATLIRQRAQAHWSR